VTVATDHYRVAGVHVERGLPPASDARPPLIFVHGGLHGSWNWHRYLPVFSAAGWECHALDWYNHHLSDTLPTAQFVRRSLADVTEEIGAVADPLPRPAVLIGHSMGGLACLKYAEQRDVEALVLLAPVLPAVIGNAPVPLDIDPAQPWGPPPYEAARQMFFGGVAEDDARRYYGLLCAESPRCVAEATGRADVPVELRAVTAATIILVGEHDVLTPVDRVKALAARMDADYRFYPGRSHSLLIDQFAEETADLIADWLSARVLASLAGD
jgi:pimeloyl-ACP methyl ester carboxylesterase